MAYRLPPLSTFRTFEAAARQLSFKLAAAELHVTPAAVSQQIKALESYLGVSLFVRRPNGLRLTEDGSAMYPKIRDGLDSFAAAVEATQHRRPPALNVTAPPAFATRWLVPRLARYSAANPAVAIRISSNPDNIDGQSSQPVPHKELIDPRRDTCEVEIRYGNGHYPDLLVEKMLTPDYVLVCSPRLLEGEGALRTPQDLHRYTLIHDESIPAVDQRPSWRLWLKLAGVSGIDSERGPRFSNSIMVLEAVIEGQGVALALRQQVEADVLAERLAIPFGISMRSAYSYYLVMAKAVAEQPVVQSFRQWLRAEIGPLYGD
ncbi:LysR substrate-binding domain-containing protein [Azonexus sp. IMCC34842]|uniref:LysR substrate-binding domain-containing protein n=1 Tax=Azonexus sp. IMCC34842 TaxID=3420950 RepID=UPI003D0D7262